jgi:hypothetical protein
MVPMTAGELVQSSAEGATAPETLRQMDRSQAKTLESRRTRLTEGATGP